VGKQNNPSRIAYPERNRIFPHHLLSIRERRVEGRGEEEEDEEDVRREGGREWEDLGEGKEGRDGNGENRA
jgi:hypothetical protein